MAAIDRERFPKLIIQIPKEEFPDKLKIMITGREILSSKDGKIAQLSANEKNGSLGQPTSESAPPSSQPAASPTFRKTYTEKDFRRTIKEKKTAKLKTPYDEITEVIGYGHREDPEDDTPINVSMFTTTQSQLPSSKKTTHNLEGVYAYNFVMTKNNMDSQYVSEYVGDNIISGETPEEKKEAATSTVAGFVGFIPQIIASIINPPIPTPKQVASKVLGPASAPTQATIASTSQKVAVVKKETEKVVTVVDAVKKVIQDPAAAIAEQMPVIMEYMSKHVSQEDVAEIVYSFKG